MWVWGLGFSTKFDQRRSWVPAYFSDIPLSGLLRTTSRSESANSFFSRLIGRKLALVEFWLRFDAALEEQRHKELEEDNITLHTIRNLKTEWVIEKHAILRSAQLSELPRYYLLERFRKDCKKTHVFDADGILLEENTSNSNDPVMQKMLSEACNQMEKLILQAKQSAAAMQLLRDELVVLGDKLNEMVPEKELSQIEEFESYLGCSIPSQIEIHPPNDTRSRGRIKRI
ncbi:hypothetical protein OsJ_11542 [Oryza sativa Japonica Group]|uniref:Protein FAR1-RELATED SEQUENCE n=2 Tax=Oryza sativa TaxID=4530 RepID=A3AJV6_ORYSJ|nr:hypothetical protein OsJ_11542 [Oryza sativa Japonica Group]